MFLDSVLTEVLKQIYFIKSIAINLSKDVNDLKNTMERENTTHIMDQREPHLLSNFKTPLETTEEFLKVEEFSKEDNNGLKLISKIILIGNLDIVIN